jgi:hypothetical protein
VVRMIALAMLVVIQRLIFATTAYPTSNIAGMEWSIWVAIEQHHVSRTEEWIAPLVNNQAGELIYVSESRIRRPLRGPISSCRNNLKAY